MEIVICIADFVLNGVICELFWFCPDAPCPISYLAESSSVKLSVLRETKENLPLCSQPCDVLARERSFFFHVASAKNTDSQSQCTHMTNPTPCNRHCANAHPTCVSERCSTEIHNSKLDHTPTNKKVVLPTPQLKNACLAILLTFPLILD